MHAPPIAKVAPRPEGDPGRGFHHRGTGETPGGVTTAEQEPLGRSVSEASRLVTSIAAALRTLRGCRVTSTVSRVLVDLVRIEVPWVSPVDLGEMLASPLLTGLVLDEFMVMERARNIATVAMCGGGR